MLIGSGAVARLNGIVKQKLLHWGGLSVHLSYNFDEVVSGYILLLCHLVVALLKGSRFDTIFAIIEKPRCHRGSRIFMLEVYQLRFADALECLD